RPAEIEHLAALFIARAASDHGQQAIPLLSPEALDLLRSYPWPGNIRELRNVIERAVLLCEGTIEIEHLPVEKMASRFVSRASSPVPAAPEGLSSSDDEERQRVLAALERCGGNQTHAARLLGISRGTLISRLTAYGVPRPRKRGPDGLPGT